MQLYLIISLIFALLTATFAVQNTVVVPVRFFMLEFNTYLVLVILGSLIVGALLLFLLGLFKQFIGWRKLRELNQKKEALEAQMKALEAQMKAAEEALRDKEAEVASLVRAGAAEANPGLEGDMGPEAAEGASPAGGMEVRDDYHG
jgi:uncharacterized integral membrane protein